MPAAVAIPAAVSLGSSIFSGVMGSSAAKKAANTQQQMAQQQAQATQQVLDKYNPTIQTAADQAKADVAAAASGAGTNLTDVAERGATGITDAATSANQYLQPYVGLGTGAATTLAGLMAPGGDLNRTFTFQDMQTLDPGYQFRIDQANKALAGSAAARGGALGGGALKAAMNLSQNVASSEYGAAFDRFEKQNQDRYSRFANLVDMGTRTGVQAGSNLMTAAQLAAAMRTGAATTAGGWDIGASEYGGTAEQQAAQQQTANALNTQRSIADLMTGGAAAKAAGTVGSANAWSGALSGVANAANQVGRYHQEQDLIDQANQGGGYPSNFTPYGAAPRTYTPTTGYPSSYTYTNPSLGAWANPSAPPPQYGYSNMMQYYTPPPYA